MRILLLTQWFDPEPTFKGLAFARALRGRGHEVEVLTGFPNYPGGSLYPGYRLRVFARETVDGVSIIRVPLYPSHDRSRLRRAANYLSFAASASLFGGALAGAPDVIYAYHPPPTVGVPAAWLGMLRGAPIVLDVQDLWPDTLAATGLVSSPLALRLAGALCNWTYRRSARVVVLSPGFRRALEERGVPGEKLRVIYNWCDEQSIVVGQRDEALALELGFDGRVNIVFAGTMGFAQALDSVVAAAERCQTECPALQFVFVGGGVDRPRLEAIAADRRLANVRFLPRQPYDAIGRILALADVLLVHLKDDPLFRITIPSKTQAYLHAGRPILMAARGDAAELVSKAGAGLVCAPEDPAGLASTAIAFARMSPAARQEMGRRGALFYRQWLSLACGVQQFGEVFAEALGGA